MYLFCNKASFYSEELSVPRPNRKLDDHPLLAVRDCLFNIFAAFLYIVVHSSIRNLRTHDGVTTRTGLPWMIFIILFLK